MVLFRVVAVERMPAASSKPDNKGSLEPIDPVKNIITVIEKKVRNLEKRKVSEILLEV